MALNIYIFVPYMSGFGGTETVISNIFREYRISKQKEYKLKLICIGGYENSEWLSYVGNAEVIRLSKNKHLRTLQYMLFLPFMIFNQIKNKDISVVVSTNPVMWSLLYWIRNMTHRKYKVVSWYHYSLEAKPVSKFLLSNADSYLAISTGIAKQLINLGIVKDKIHIVYNPVLRNSLRVPRSKIGLPSEFIYIGRIMLDGQKNLRFLLDALANVHGIWKLRIFGDGEIQKVKDYARSKGILSNLVFEGFKSKPLSEINSADALLLVSKYEGFPMVLNEAISVGVPVVSVNCETGPSDIVNKYNGILVENISEKYSEVLQKFIDRKIVFYNLDCIKMSISRFYSDNYFDYFIQSF